MRESVLNQKTRFVLLLLDLMILCVASWFVFGSVFPPSGDKGFWFYTALLGLLLGSRLDTPFFAKPSDVVLYAAPAAVALVLANSWIQWGDGVRVAYCIAMAYCIIVGSLGSAAILMIDVKSVYWQRVSNAARILAETLGAPRMIYSAVIGFALFAYHSTSTKEFGVIFAAWVLTGIFSPLEGLFKICKRLGRIFEPNTIFDVDGEVVAYQTPGLILVRQSNAGKICTRDVVAIHDSLGQVKLALVLDRVGRDEGILLRAIEIADAEISTGIVSQLSLLPPNSVVSLSALDDVIAGHRLVESKESLVGLVAPDSSIERLFFEVVKDDGLEEGRLVEVQIGKRIVTYQLVNGLTKEEIVQQKNTHGFARAQAQKIGEWDDAAKKFRFVKWLPSPNAPVFLKNTEDFQVSSGAVGHFPGTNYPVMIKSVDELVTHNTAILGILGVGKSMLAIELVERMMVGGVKVICIDLTNQYSLALTSYYNSVQEQSFLEKLKIVGAAGKTRVKKNVEEGGSRREFSQEVEAQLEQFLKLDNPLKLKIFNPVQFEVWRQDSKPFQDTASMATLTPAEITQIISEATFKMVSNLGMTDRARACLVYEEAHSLVPEWNSSVNEGDRSASNGSARAILQGRKYGLGCLLVTQRTANVTKTILNQCNTIFAMRTFDDTGKGFLSNYIGEAYTESLASLSERQAIFFGKASSCENPILIRLNDREKFLQAFREINPPPPLPMNAATAAASEPASPEVLCISSASFGHLSQI